MTGAVPGWDTLGKWGLGASLIVFMYWVTAGDDDDSHVAKVLTQIQVKQSEILTRLEQTATKTDLEQVISHGALMRQRLDNHISRHPDGRFLGGTP